jgi:hypothetical protein
LVKHTTHKGCNIGSSPVKLIFFIIFLMIKFNNLKNKILYDVNYIKDYNKNKKKFIYFEYSLAEIAVHNHIQSYKIDKIFQNKVLYLYKKKK